MGAQPWVAYTQYDYATMLLARDQPGDREKAQELLVLALTTAHELGMTLLQSKVQGLKSKAQIEQVRRSTFTVQGAESRDSQKVISAQPLVPNPRPPTPNVFRRDGDYWTLVYEGQECRLKDAKGVHYLAALMHNPGREFHVLDLLLLTDPPPATTAAEEHLSPARRARRAPDASPPVDAQARAAYKSRLQDVQAELEEADRHHDLGRLATLQAEQTFLTEELTAAYGFRRQARQASDSHDQVRKNVTKRLRDLLSRLRTLHPPAWRHLQRSLKTGAFVRIPQSVTSRGRGRHPKVSEQSNCPARPIQGDKPDSLFPSSFFPVDSCRNAQATYQRAIDISSQ